MYIFVIGPDQYDEFEEEPEDKPLENDFILKSFEKSTGCQLKLPSEYDNNIEQEFKELMDKYCSRTLEDLSWPLDLTKVIPKPEQKVPSEKDLKRLKYFSDKLLEQKMEPFKKNVEKNMAVIKNSNDLSEIINDLIEGKPLEKLKIKEEFSDPFAWKPVYESESVDVKNKDYSNVLFSRENDQIKMDFDEDYYIEQEHVQDPVYDFNLGQNLSPVNIENWNPFPDPDAELPPDLYELHKNEWLRMQYQLWLQKIQTNRALIEQYTFQQN